MHFNFIQIRLDARLHNAPLLDAITIKNINICDKLLLTNMTIYDENMLILIENSHFNRK